MSTAESVSTHAWGTFYEQSPILCEPAVRDGFSRWWRDEQCKSEIVPIAFVEPTEEEIAALNAPFVTDRKCSKIPEDHPAALALGGLIGKYRAAVAYDRARYQLQGDDFREHIEAGRYDRRPIPHVDDGKMAVRWMAAWGVGSTVGYNGQIKLSDTMGLPGLYADAYAGDLSNFKELREPEGTILRIRTFGDLHTWPEGEGVRLYLQSTLYLEEGR